MRGSDNVTGSLFSYVDLEESIPARRPLRKIRRVVNDALRPLDAEFDRLHAGEGSTRRNRNTKGDFRGDRCSKATHASMTDPDARLFKKWSGTKPWDIA